MKDNYFYKILIVFSLILSTTGNNMHAQINYGVMAGTTFIQNDIIRSLNTQLEELRYDKVSSFTILNIGAWLKDTNNNFIYSLMFGLNADAETTTITKKDFFFSVSSAYELEINKSKWFVYPAIAVGVNYGALTLKQNEQKITNDYYLGYCTPAFGIGYSFKVGKQINTVIKTQLGYNISTSTTLNLEGNNNYHYNINGFNYQFYFTLCLIQ